MRKKLACLLFIFFANWMLYSPGIYGQASATDQIDISKITLEKKIGDKVYNAFVPRKSDLVKEYPGISFEKGLKFKNAVVANNYVTQKALLKFHIFNSGDESVTVYFSPGFYFDKIRLYNVKETEIIQLQTFRPSVPDSIGFSGITLPGKDSATIIAELYLVKTYNNIIKPRLVNSDNVPEFIASIHTAFNNNALISYIFCGLLLMMLLYSLSIFIQGGNPEFLYYSGYALMLGIMLLLQNIMHLRSNSFSFFLEGYFDFILQGTSIIFYMLFMRRFLNTKENYSFLYKLYNSGIIFLIAALLLYTYLFYFTDKFELQNIVENITKIFLLGLIIIFLVYSLGHWNDKILRYIFWGNLLLFLFAFISQLGIIFDSTFKKFPGILSSSLFYYEMGLLLELVFFLAGLNHKNRRKLIEQVKERETLKAQNRMQKYEKELAVYKAQQEERERISADMHDELGAGMTAIRLMSEIARNKMKENTPTEINKISQSANDVLNKMNAIIWSMNSGNDTLDNLIYYIRSYALEYFDGTDVNCKVIAPEKIPEKDLAGDKRRNLFLVVKETLNNTLKHAEAKNVMIEISFNHELLIQIKDDGKGIDMQNLRYGGNGLKNMGRRMDSIGGTYKIEKLNGTVTTLTIPL